MSISDKEDSERCLNHDIADFNTRLATNEQFQAFCMKVIDNQTSQEKCASSLFSSDRN